MHIGYLAYKAGDSSAISNISYIIPWITGADTQSLSVGIEKHGEFPYEEGTINSHVQDGGTLLVINT